MSQLVAIRSGEPGNRSKGLLVQTRISKAPYKQLVLELARKLPQDAEGGGAPAELT